jgi:hypothetical protein
MHRSLPSDSIPGAVTVRRALVSVSDKRGVVELGQALAARGVEILSTGGTASALAAAGVPVIQVSAWTGAPEILDGRVKTLHPKVHGGLLGRPIPSHQAEMAAHGIEAIDLVVVNLDPFEAAIARPDVTYGDAIENIDIGGPAMLRSAAKNHERVAVVVDPDDYAGVLADLEYRRRDHGDPAAGAGLARLRAHRRLRRRDRGVPVGGARRRADPAGRGAAPRRVPGHADRAVAQAVRPALRREPAPVGRVLRRRSVAAAADAGDAAEPGHRRGAGRQAALLQQPARSRRRAGPRARVRRRRAPGGDRRQAQQPVRRRARRHARQGLRPRPRPIRSARSAASSP